MPLEAVVSLKREDAANIGRDRMRLLEAVARERSISAGARAVGLTYKAAWDALDAMSNAFGAPLLETRTGGRAGGGAVLTPTGLKVIEAFRRLEGEMARVVRTLDSELAGTGISPRSLVTGFFMKTSARNVLRGRIAWLAQDAISTEVGIAVTPETIITALVTNDSVESLGLVTGREVMALVKAPFVVIASGDTPPRVSTRNCIAGTIRRCEMSTVQAEVVLAIGGDKTLAATISTASAKALDLAVGAPAYALFDSAHVILAID